MIEQLHNEINNIIPINGIEYNYADNICLIHYTDPQTVPSPQQQTEIDDLINAWPLTLSKILKIEELDKDWFNTLNVGWLTPYGWRLGLTNNDVTLLTGVFVLAKEAKALGINDPVSVIDTTGSPRTLSFEDLTLLMLQYGNFRSQLSSKYASIKSQIKNLNSIIEIEQLNIANLLLSS
jgi:hypothetical protein